MADKEQVEKAIRGAIAAGDHESARRIAREFKTAGETAEPGMMDKVLSGQGLLGLSPEETVQKSLSPLAAPVAQQSQREAPSLTGVGEVLGGTLGAMVPAGRLPGLLAGAARVVGAGAGGFAGSYAGSGGQDVQEAQNAGARSMIGEGLGETAMGLGRAIFRPQTFVPGAAEAQSLVRAQGGNLPVAQLVEGGFGKRLQEFTEMTLMGRGPIQKKKIEAEKIIEKEVMNFLDTTFPNLSEEEAGRLIQKSIERAGIAKLKKGYVTAQGKTVPSKIIEKPYTGTSIEFRANQQFLVNLMKKNPDSAYRAVRDSKSPSLIRKLRGITGPDWDVIQGRYLNDLLTQSIKPGTVGDVSGSKLFDKVSKVNDARFKEFIPDPDQRRNLLTLARSARISETHDGFNVAGGWGIQTMIFGAGGMGYALGLTGVGSTAAIILSPYALGKVLATKTATDLLSAGMKPGISAAKASGLMARMGLLLNELELVEGQDYEVQHQ